MTSIPRASSQWSMKVGSKRLWCSVAPCTLGVLGDRRCPTLKKLQVRLDSGGGEVTGWHAITEFHRERLHLSCRGGRRR